MCEITFPKKERFSHPRLAWDLDTLSKQVMDGAEVQAPYIVDKDGQGKSEWEETSTLVSLTSASVERLIGGNIIFWTTKKREKSKEKKGVQRILEQWDPREPCFSSQLLLFGARRLP